MLWRHGRSFDVLRTHAIQVAPASRSEAIGGAASRFLGLAYGICDLVGPDWPSAGRHRQAERTLLSSLVALRVSAVRDCPAPRSRHSGDGRVHRPRHQFRPDEEMPALRPAGAAKRKRVPRLRTGQTPDWLKPIRPFGPAGDSGKPARMSRFLPPRPEDTGRRARQADFRETRRLSDPSVRGVSGGKRRARSQILGHRLHGDDQRIGPAATDGANSLLFLDDRSSL
jgi:hypothetical protein